MDQKKLLAHLEELRKKHRTLDNEIKNIELTSITEEVRRLKTEKLWLKDEIYRIEKQLINGGLTVKHLKF